MWEGAWDRTELQYFDPTSYSRQRCVFLIFQGCSTGGPEAHSAGCGLSLPHLVTNGSPNTIGGPEGPFSRKWLSLPHLTSNFSGPQLNRGPRGPLRSAVAFPTSSHLQLQLSLTVLTELYNSSTPTQLLTQSLEWLVWSSLSGNNCHAVQSSLFSGASVYECIMGFFPRPILLAKSTYTIFPHKCHRNVSLPSGASPWNGKFGRVEGQNTTYAWVLAAQRR